MTTASDDRTHVRPPQRWAWWGFLVGVAITVPATFFALLFHSGEALHPYLVPSTALLGPLSDVMATWPGLIAMALAAVVNGGIYAAVAALGARVVRLRRHAG